MPGLTMGVKCVKYVKQQTKRQQTRFKLLFPFNNSGEYASRSAAA